jgi:N-acetyl-gamma-glutamyl-phosphate reductase
MGDVKKISVGIAGGAGYTGGEAIRILLRHPHAEIAFVQSRSQAGKKISASHPDLVGDTNLTFTESMDTAVDVLFLCLSHGESKKLLQEKQFAEATRIIDLGNDFRLGAAAGSRQFAYGLPEFQREAIRTAKNIANPGCFATAIQLGLLPLANAGLLTEVHTTGITGSTGAGQKLQDTLHFSWRANNISAYKTLAHQHLNEINRTLSALQPHYNGSLYFVPWRGDFTRGVFVTSVVRTSASEDEIKKMYTDFYQPHPFTHVAGERVDLKQVINTNKCLLHIEKVGEHVAIHSVIDNLLKGASGQAVQNMNLMFGFDERAGLNLKSNAF